MAGSKMGRMMRQVQQSAKKLIVPFGKIASGTYLKVNIKNVADSEAREIRVIAPYGISSCPIPDLFAQIIMNDHINNTCPGIWNDKAPEAKPGEIILYNKENKVQVKLSEDNGYKVWNEKGSIEVKPDGTIVITNGAGTVTIASNGAITIQNNGSTISMAPGGAVTINATSFTVNSSGAVKINGSMIDFN